VRSTIGDTHTNRCFKQIADELFKMVLDEEDAAVRRGMDTALDHTINNHRMSMLRNVGEMLREVGGQFVADFDKRLWMGQIGFNDE